MIGVVIPAHSEENHIHQCVISIIEAANHPGLNGMPVRLVVVLDACTDATEGLAASAGAMVLNVHHKNVGKARGAGAELLLKLEIFPSRQHAMGRALTAGSVKWDRADRCVYVSGTEVTWSEPDGDSRTRDARQVLSR